MASSSSSTVPSRASSISRRSSGDFTDEVDPRRLFTAVHSEGDIYSNLYNCHAHGQLTRTQSEPTALNGGSYVQHAHASGMSSLGLETGPGLGSSVEWNGSGYDPSVAPTSPWDGRFNLGNTSPRRATHPLDRHGNDNFGFVENGGALALSRYEQLPSFSDYGPLHPSQWTSFFPSYAQYPPVSSSCQLQPESSYHNDLVALQAQPVSSLDSTFLPFLSAGDSEAQQGLSPQEPLLLTPHDIGPIFSEAYISDVFAEEPRSMSSPDLLNRPLNEPCSQTARDMRHRAYRPPPTVDFTSLQHGVVSPALSDATVTDPRAFEDDPGRALSPNITDTPVIADLDAFDAFDEDFTPGLSLFGGLGVANGYAQPSDNRDPGTSDGGWDFADAERTPRGSPRSPPQSPRQLEFARPMRAGGGHSSAGMQMPPTPRLSPLLSSF
ncbi:hypothetical protein DFH11DRAFT_390349 [Phellopilus nigrolimitatus]|nr:hypothetical protein DFH11DRAFT_390349 [Phellopilus nigrolimitatus]